MPGYAGGSSSLFLIPCNPPASMPATATYGLTSPPGRRSSGRSEDPEPTTRTEQVRLSSPQATLVGAKLPAANLLYELTFGAYSRVNSRSVARSPATKPSNTSVRSRPAP